MKPHPVLLVTGSSGLIGSEVCTFFAQLGWTIHGVDNNQRAAFFGPAGDTRWNQHRLETSLPAFHHHELDIRDRAGMGQLFAELRPTAIVHAAAQPSHDRAADIPFDDFDVNAVGTLNLLVAARQHCPESPLVYLSTNKVYGDRPNTIKMKELATRWDYDDSAYEHGIAENFPIDQSKHSLFGASKLAADILVQEYGRYFNQPTCCLRGGCLTGPNHSGVELHGFLSYLVKCNLEQKEYRVFGYHGKQVRDNLHAGDVARFIHAFIEKPRAGEVYNLGGGRDHACSLLEAFVLTQEFTGLTQKYTCLDQARAGDHICYYSDLRKMKAHYPSWSATKSLRQTIREIVEAWQQRNAAP